MQGPASYCGGGTGPTGPREGKGSPPRENRQIARPHPDAAARGGHGGGRISRPDPRTGGGLAALGSGSEASRGARAEPCQRSAASGPQHPAASAARTRDGEPLISQERLSVTAETQGQTGHPGRPLAERGELAGRGLTMEDAVPNGDRELRLCRRLTDARTTEAPRRDTALERD